MKVEIVKVKLSKLREVKRELRKGKNRKEINLKNLLLGEVKGKSENEELYNTINGLFQDTSNNGDALDLPVNSENSSNYHLDLDELIQSLETPEADISTKESPDNNILELKSNINTVETQGSIDQELRIDQDLTQDNNTEQVKTQEHNINKTVDNCDVNGLSNELYNNHQQCDGIYYYNRVETESILWYSSNDPNLNETIKINEPPMMELGHYYTTDTVVSNIHPSNMMDENGIMKQEEFCNEIEIATTELNSAALKGDEELNPEETNNEDNKLVNPLEINCAGVDLKAIAMHQLIRKNNNEMEDMEILKNYNEEQKMNIIDAAKVLYTKRTRTLLHWLDPKLPLSKLKSTLCLSWQNLPVWQKEVYISQVMGPLTVDLVSPMLNPQLTAGGYETVTPTLTKKSAYKIRRNQQC